MILSLILAGLLAVACVVFVARPFLVEPDAPRDTDRLREPGLLDRRRVELLEERDRALAALKELEFDHRTGKLSDEDYRAVVGPLRRRAAEALRALEPRAEERGGVTRGDVPTTNSAGHGREVTGRGAGRSQSAP